MKRRAYIERRIKFERIISSRVLSFTRENFAIIFFFIFTLHDSSSLTQDSSNNYNLFSTQKVPCEISQICRLFSSNIDF